MPKRIKSWIVQDICYETYPCKHNVVLTYEDGTKETTMFSNGTPINTTNGTVNINLHAQ